jgi:hypothetical protein
MEVEAEAGLVQLNLVQDVFVLEVELRLLQLAHLVVGQLLYLPCLRIDSLVVKKLAKGVEDGIRIIFSKLESLILCPLNLISLICYCLMSIPFDNLPSACSCISCFHGPASC